MNVGMVFAMIFAIVLIGFVLVLGADQIVSVFCLTTDAQVLGSIRSIENEVDQLYNLAEGSSKSFGLGVPGNSVICFVDPNDPGSNLDMQWDADPVYVTIISEEGYNVWFEDCSGKDGYRIDGMIPRENFCISSGTELYLENKGTYVELSI